MEQPATDPRTWSVGELAAACGVTVRTLHHYERLGLVVASARTGAGHRRYTEPDVHRLYRVLALRQMGLRLGAIAGWLDTDTDVAALVREHLERVERELDRVQDLRQRLTRLLARSEDADRPATDELMAVMEVMGMYDDHLSPEQRTRLRHHRSELGYPGIDRWRAEAADAMAALQAAHGAGADPGGPEVRALVERIRLLKQQLAGRDPDLGASLRAVHTNPPWDEIQALIPTDPALRDFWRRARDATGAGGPSRSG